MAPSSYPATIEPRLADAANPKAGPALPTGLSGAAGDWPTLAMPTVPRVVRWHLLGSRFAAASTLSLRAPLGELRVTAELQDGLLTGVIGDSAEFEATRVAGDR